MRGGIAHSLIDGTKMKAFQSWQINLWMVNAFFGGETCGWNTAYKAAQMIYGDNIRAKIIRKGIKIQHSKLYSKDCGVGFYKEFGVRGLGSFFQMIRQSYSDNSKRSTSAETASNDNDNNNENDAERRFTYVILPDSTMHFSCTGKKTAEDFLSKHALHARAKKVVVYAGEFFFDTLEGPAPKLIIDNNSGTFAPPKAKLALLKALLEFNFGKAMPIVALDREDPDLQKYIESNNIQ